MESSLERKMKWEKVALTQVVIINNNNAMPDKTRPEKTSDGINRRERIHIASRRLPEFLFTKVNIYKLQVNVSAIAMQFDV